jgi:hypothetical protein
MRVGEEHEIERPWRWRKRSKRGQRHDGSRRSHRLQEISAVDDHSYLSFALMLTQLEKYLLSARPTAKSL